MRQRSWLFYRTVLYIGLLLAFMLVGIILYLISLRPFGKNSTDILLLATAVVQVTFYSLCVSLLHYFVAKRLPPGRVFSIAYWAALIANSCIGICLLILLSYYVSNTFLQPGNRPDRDAWLAFILLSGYTFITLYISAASVVLRRYNRYQVMADEEKEWLNQLGENVSA